VLVVTHGESLRALEKGCGAKKMGVSKKNSYALWVPLSFYYLFHSLPPNQELYLLYSQAGTKTLSECNQAMANHLARLFCDREMLFTVSLSTAKDNKGYMQLSLRSISKIDYTKSVKLLAAANKRVH
jgi:hypothetical protein